MEVEESSSESALVLPEKSKHLYEKTFRDFTVWCQENQKQVGARYSEAVLLQYFVYIADKGMIASLWPKYSMLKTTLNVKECIDISSYTKLTAFIKQRRAGYVVKKSKVLEKEHVDKFIADAPDNLFLMTKVALIFGVAGALRREELLKLQTQDVKDAGQQILVTVKGSGLHKTRIFTIDDPLFQALIRRYVTLRPPHTAHKRFFVFYKNNKCSVQPVGINTFPKLPGIIASFLKLSEPHLYTGHCFRRTADIVGLRRSTFVAQDPASNNFNEQMLTTIKTELAEDICTDNQNEEPSAEEILCKSDGKEEILCKPEDSLSAVDDGKVVLCKTEDSLTEVSVGKVFLCKTEYSSSEVGDGKEDLTKTQDSLHEVGNGKEVFCKTEESCSSTSSNAEKRSFTNVHGKDIRVQLNSSKFVSFSFNNCTNVNINVYK